MGQSNNHGLLLKGGATRQRRNLSTIDPEMLGPIRYACMGQSNNHGLLLKGGATRQRRNLSTIDPEMLWSMKEQCQQSQQI